MIIDKTFGPQFDLRDGTIGNIQLVKRFVILKKDGAFFLIRQGRYTFSNREACEKAIECFTKNNPTKSEFVEGIYAQEYWCYPGHLDPACPVEIEYSDHDYEI